VAAADGLGIFQGEGENWMGAEAMTDPLRELLRESVDAWADKDAEWWADWHERFKAALALAENAGQIKDRFDITNDAAIAEIARLTEEQARQIKAQALREAVAACLAVHDKRKKRSGTDFGFNAIMECKEAIELMASEHERGS
jgi:hypothetical protein